MFANYAKQSFSRNDWLLIKGGFTCGGCCIFSISFGVFTLGVHICLPQIDLFVQNVGLFSLDNWRETDVDKGGSVVEVHHFGGKVLSARIMQRHTAIFAAGDQ